MILCRLLLSLVTLMIIASLVGSTPPSHCSGDDYTRREEIVIAQISIEAELDQEMYERPFMGGLKIRFKSLAKS